eukprot:391926-Rhodomonas_salina.1
MARYAISSVEAYAMSVVAVCAVSTVAAYTSAIWGPVGAQEARVGEYSRGIGGWRRGVGDLEDKLDG